MIFSALTGVWPVRPRISFPCGITVGFDGDLWLTENNHLVELSGTGEFSPLGANAALQDERAQG